jgi:hypothetical protein
MMRRFILPLAAFTLLACSSAGPESSPVRNDSGMADAGHDRKDGGRPRDASPETATTMPDATRPDAAATCSVGGLAGQCILVTDCATMTGYSSTPGYCPGPADIECCTLTPSVADNPPTPAGYMLMLQSEVTPAMTAWAVSILDDPTTYPMFSTATMTFGTQLVLARVEWHPPDFNNSSVHRGVTLYVPV